MGDYIIHYGVKGMKWGVRKQPNFIQRRRQATMRSASELAAKRSRMYGQDANYYSNNKNRKGSSTKSDMKRWASASNSAKKYFDSKKKEYSNLSSSRVSRKQVKNAKKWMKNYGFHTEAEFADIQSKNGTTNYLNNLSDFDSRRKR